MDSRGFHRRDFELYRREEEYDGKRRKHRTLYAACQHELLGPYYTHITTKPSTHLSLNTHPPSDSQNSLSSPNTRHPIPPPRTHREKTLKTPTTRTRPCSRTRTSKQATDNPIPVPKTTKQAVSHRSKHAYTLA